MKLYEISQRMKNVLDVVQAEHDDDTDLQSQLEQFQDLEISFQEKLDATMLAYFDKTASITAVDEELKRLAKHKAYLVRQQKQIKSYLDYCMNTSGKQKHESDMWRISYRSSASVYISDDALLPAEYITTKTTTSPDKTAIKVAIKWWKEVPGASLVESRNIQIK